MSWTKGKKLVPIKNQSGELSGYLFFCPGCKYSHTFDVDRWTFDGNMELPTFNPSLLYEGYIGEGRPRDRCHLYLEAGIIKFLSDCSHELAGQEVEMVEFPY